MKQLTVKGTHYKCGVQIGRHFNREIKERLKLYGITSHKTKQYQQQLHQILKSLPKIYHPYVDEIHGLATGSKSDFWQLFLLNCPELSQEHHGCSSIAQIDQNKIILAHNEDSDPTDKKANTALIKFILPSTIFHSFTYLGELPGCAYSWNQQGLFFTVNNIKAKKINLNFTPRYFITRALIECTSIKEAVQFLKHTKNASAFHYFLGQKRKILSIEQLHDRISIKEINITNFHTNHFIHDKFYNNAEIYTRSRESYKLLEKLLKTKDIFTSLFDKSNHPHAIYARTGDTSRTLSTVLFKPLHHKVEIYPTDSRKLKKVFYLNS